MRRSLGNAYCVAEHNHCMRVAKLFVAAYKRGRTIPEVNYLALKSVCGSGHLLYFLGVILATISYVKVDRHA